MTTVTDEWVFSLISPVYNEEKTIRELVKRSVGSLQDSGLLQGKKWEYILVDDASTDSTPDVISEVMSEYPDIVVGARHKERGGQGEALKTGFFLGRGHIFGTLDSDLEKLPEDTPKLLREYLEKDCDVVCSYVKHKDIYSKLGNFALRTLFSHSVQQASTCQMVIGASFIRRVNLVKNDQRYVLPIAMSLGAKNISEVETSFTPREYGRSQYSLTKKVLCGFPEMLSLKYRIYKGDYDKLLDDDYRSSFDFIQPG